MQSSDFEKLVEAYLLYDRTTLVAPQFPIRVAGRDRFIDVLAVQLRERTFLSRRSDGESESEEARRQNPRD